MVLELFAYRPHHLSPIRSPVSPSIWTGDTGVRMGDPYQPWLRSRLAGELSRGRWWPALGAGGSSQAASRHRVEGGGASWKQGLQILGEAPLPSTTGERFAPFYW